MRSLRKTGEWKDGLNRWGAELSIAFGDVLPNGILNYINDEKIYKCIELNIWYGIEPGIIYKN